MPTPQPLGVPEDLPPFEVWLDLTDGATASGRRYVVYRRVLRFHDRTIPEQRARAERDLVFDVATGEVYDPSEPSSAAA